MTKLALRIGVFLLTSAVFLRATAAELPKELVDKVNNKLVKAHKTGDRRLAWSLLAPMLEQLDETQTAELDELLGDQFLPPIAQMVADIRLAPGTAKLKLKPASRGEVIAVLRHAAKSIQDAMDGRKWISVMDPDRARDTSFEEFDRAVWDAHVYRNELENAATLAVRARRFQLQNRNALAKSNTGRVADFEQLLKKLYQVRLELHERDLLLKLDRIKYAVAQLRKLNKADQEAHRSKADQSDVEAAKTRLWANFALQKDGDTLIAALDAMKNSRGKNFVFIDELKTSQSKSDAKRQIHAGRQLAGRSLKRSEQLFDGLHWWFRGRYGRGSHNMGLLKPPAAARNIHAQNALKMPKLLPRPTDPAMFARQTDLMKEEARSKIARQSKVSKPLLLEANWKAPAENDWVTDANVEKDAKSSDSQTGSYVSNAEADDYVYGIAYDKKYTRSPDYDRRHHYVWSQKPPMFVSQSVGMYFH